MRILDDYKWRYATKSFDPTKKLSQENLSDLSEALRLAPSSFGLQPWKFIFVQDQKIRSELLPFSMGNQQVVNCSHLVVMCAPLELGNVEVDKFLNLVRNASNLNGITQYEAIIKGFLSGLGQEQKKVWMAQQIHIALGFLLSAAASLRIDACPLGGFSPTDYDRVLGLKEKGLASVVLCALGHRHSDDKYAKAPKSRFALADVVEFL